MRSSLAGYGEGVEGIAPLQADEFRRIVAQASPGIVITECEPLDEPGPRIVYVNEAFTIVTGYEPSEVIGRSPRLLQGPGTEPDTRARIRSALEARAPVEVEITNRRNGGAPFVSEMVIAPALDEHGSCTHFVAVQKDVTVRRHMEAVARQLGTPRESGEMAQVLSTVAEIREREREWLSWTLRHDALTAVVAAGFQLQMTAEPTAPVTPGDLGDTVNTLRAAEAAVRRAVDELAVQDAGQPLETSLESLGHRVARAVGVPVTVTWEAGSSPSGARAGALYTSVRDTVMTAAMTGAASAMSLVATASPPVVSVEIDGIAPATAASDVLGAVVHEIGERLSAHGYTVEVDRSGFTLAVEIRSPR